MDYSPFALGYFALLAGVFFLFTAFLHIVGPVFGLRRDNILTVALAFGATHAIISVASLLVPPAQPVMIVLLSTAVALLFGSRIVQRKHQSVGNFMQLMGNICAVSGVSFEAFQHLTIPGFVAYAPLAIILLTSLLIGRLAYALPTQPAPTARS